ncbi:MAG: hypothetical protein P0119_22330 [Nitrospira sp.]|nr:hypothetical protein [Nitrospira sp.]
MKDATTLDDIHRIASEHAMPWIDLLFIAVNANGASSTFDLPRVRTQLRPSGSMDAWQIILPLASGESPFFLDEKGLSLAGETVADLVTLENDDVVLTYLRGGGRSITLNTHARSACTGCVFCPNVIEDAADAMINGVDGLAGVLTWVRADNGWEDLSGVEVITVCSGCFQHPDAAVRHMTDLREAAKRQGFDGRLHLLSSVVRDRSHIEQLADGAGPFHLTLTLECFTRRSMLLKESKASLTLDDACRTLDFCKEGGVVGDFTYVAGIDPLADAIEGLKQLASHVTTFPRIQIYQAHNEYMRVVRPADTATIAFYVALREAIEPTFAERGLRPVSWENYRPLWYTDFAGQPIHGPRI